MENGMTTNMKRATELLFGADGLGVSNFKMFPGSSRDTSAEVVAKSVVDAVERVLAGDFEEVPLD